MAQIEGRAVALGFKGSYEQKIDAKGRVSIPAAFRGVLEAGDPAFGPEQRPSLVLFFGDPRNPYLECYTVRAMEEIDAGIARLQRGTEVRKMLERMYHGHSLVTELDGDGRIVLPQRLRQKARLGAEAFFIAHGDHFQLWDQATYDAEAGTLTEDWLARHGAEFDPLSVVPSLPAG